MVSPVSESRELQTAAAVSRSPSGKRIGPDRTGDGTDRHPVSEAIRNAELEREHDEDRGLKAAESILADLADPSVGVTFVKVDGVDEPVIRVVNRETGEVVRQIPPDEVLELRKRFGELLGMFKDLRA